MSTSAPAINFQVALLFIGTAMSSVGTLLETNTVSTQFADGMTQKAAAPVFSLQLGTTFMLLSSQKFSGIKCIPRLLSSLP